MHDIDRALFEAEAEFGESGTGEYEFGEYEGSSQETGEYEFGEAPGETSDREAGLANELLEVSGERELDRFLGDLISGAVSAVRDFARTDAGKAVGGVLKSAARTALPQIGKLAGDALMPGRGGALGQRAGQWAASRFELAPETEGMSAEDREYETARAFVRFAEETAQRAARVADSVPPAVAAQRAAQVAARTHLPGLLRLGGPSPTGTPPREGRWVRRGNRIVVLGL